MVKKYDVQIDFELEQFKLVFDELFLKKLDKPLQVKVSTKIEKKKSDNEDLMNSSRWVSINFFDQYFIGETWENNHIEVYNFIFIFFDYLFKKLEFLCTKTNLLKIVFHSKNGIKLCFLFNEVYSLKSLKERFSEVINKIVEYRNGNIKIVEEIKSSFKLKHKEVFFITKKKSWVLINLLSNAGKHHHDFIAQNIADKRISKPLIYINEEKLDETI